MGVEHETFGTTTKRPTPGVQLAGNPKAIHAAAQRYTTKWRCYMSETDLCVRE